jgi:hypothetical protein
MLKFKGEVSAAPQSALVAAAGVVYNEAVSVDILVSRKLTAYVA